MQYSIILALNLNQQLTSSWPVTRADSSHARAHTYTLHTQNDNDQITMAARIEEAGRIAEVILLYDRCGS